MTPPTLQPVVLAGGAGTRLWPLSREHRPKQFLNLLGPQSLLQQTLARLDGLPCHTPYVICNEAHRFLAAEQLRQAGVQGAHLFLEPVARNTAPALALAALDAVRDGDDPLLLVLPADHVIRNVPAFHDAVAQAAELAEQDRLVTFGIEPECAETGYGYIRRGEPLGPGWAVASFVEKPDAARAAEYLVSGQYYWNSGMFLFRASRYLQELAQFAPAILAAMRQALAGARHDLDFIRLDEQAFIQSPSASIDYAVMEHTRQAAVISLDAGWNDLGTWESLATERGRDAAGNSLQGDVLVRAVQNTVVQAADRLVAVVGVQDLVIVETKDAVLVSHRDAAQAQGVKRIVAQLQALDRPEAIQHREVYRPWGVFDAIGSGPRYQVKKITVKPGARLSLQKHRHRAEHWIVVSGTARVTNGDKTYLVAENQSTYIPIGQVYSLENPGTIPLELIEVQSGDYLGEDDIVRLEDLYGRT